MLRSDRGCSGRHLQVVLAAFALATVPLAALAQTPAARTPITHEKLWMMKRIGGPVVSPDGKWVVYSVLEPSYEPDKEVSDLWLAAADARPASTARRKPPHRSASHEAVSCAVRAVCSPCPVGAIGDVEAPPI